jgi:hypothetical protein
VLKQSQQVSFTVSFCSEVSDPLLQDSGYANHFTATLENLRIGCEQYGRVFSVMYDVTDNGVFTPDQIWAKMKSDWISLVDSGLVDSHRYLKHDGKPLVAIWGLGFVGRPFENHAQAMEIIKWFQADAPEEYKASVFGGVPSHWRQRYGDSETDPEWDNVYRAFDVLSPWTVGRYTNLPTADWWKINIVDPDIAETKTAGISYCPVIFPGFSWRNARGDPKNQIPRMGGTLF